MIEEKNSKSFTVSDASKFTINPETIYSVSRFVIPDVVSIDLKTGEVELHIDDVSEAAKRFWEEVKRIAGGR